MLENILNEVSQEFETLRSKNKLIHKKREIEIREKFAEFDSIQKEISSMGLKLLKSSINLNESDIENITKQFKADVEKLTERKKDILVKNGYSPDYLDEIYECSICKDSGIYGTEKCICYTKKLINTIYKYSNLKDKLGTENFDTFNMDYYSKETGKNIISPYENIKILYKTANDYVENFPNGQNILIRGLVGTGKTFMCNCIAKALIDKGNIVLYLSSFQLYQLIEYDTFKRDKNEPSNPILELVTQADLLIIDDLGMETVNVIFDSALFNYINTRESFGKSTIISTNFSIREIKERYSERIASRIIGNFRIMNFFGEDIRILKRKKANK